jgi:nucleoside-diphosphate-sugar epimerase
MPRPHLARVLVTGASGTLGYNIVRHLGATHPKTRVHVLMRTPDETLFGDLTNVDLEHVDMADFAGVSRAVQAFQPNAIIHCAASGVRPSGIDWFEQIHLNVSATVALFQASCAIPDCHFIHVSTGLVYSEQDRPCREHDPIDTLHPYGASKAAADCLLRAGAERMKRHMTVVRPFSFTGLHDGGDRLFPSLLRAAAAAKPFPMSAGTQIRDFCAVQDVAEAIVMVLELGTVPGRDVFNLGSGRSIPLREIVRSVCDELGLEVQIEFGAVPFHPLEPMHLVADIDLAQTLGWRPHIRLAYAVWQLAEAMFPGLALRQPYQFEGQHEAAEATMLTAALGRS